MDARSMQLFRRREGVAAVEFALIAPLLTAFFFGTICFATVLSTTNGLQQLAAESARASVAGLSDPERDTLVRSFVSANLGAYPFLSSSKLTVTTTSLTTPSPGFQVSLTYDLSTSFIYQFAALLPLPAPRLATLGRRHPGGRIMSHRGEAASRPAIIRNCFGAAGLTNRCRRALQAARCFPRDRKRFRPRS